MKADFKKVIFLIVMIVFAYKSLNRGFKSFRPKPAVVSNGEVLIDSATMEEFIIDTGQMAQLRPEKDNLIDVSNNWGERIPFFSPQESKISLKESKSSLEERAPAISAAIPSLTTILSYGGNWYAILDGNLVKTGDRISGIRILEIKDNLVKIEKTGRIYELKLWQ